MTHPSTSKPSTRQTALITGASSGIGEALAHCFATAKMDLVLVARSVGKLRDLSQTLAAKHGVTVRVQPADLSQPGAVAYLHADLQRKRCRVDVLVNCAGVLEQGAFTAIAPEKHQAITSRALLPCWVPLFRKWCSGAVGGCSMWPR